MSEENALVNLSQLLVNYQKERLRLESVFIGLPDAYCSLVKSLISLAEPTTGVVNNISYHDLAKILTIKPAPGRKESGTPTKQTIRNYIKSIEKECGDYFKVITDGQNLQFFFPEMPKIFKEVFQNTEVNTALNAANTLINTEKNKAFEEEVNIELNTEVNTPHTPVKNIFIYKNINNNNNIPDKKLITEDFNPSPITIERAEALGFTNANDPKEIHDFIAYNQANGSRWVDFNPVYLRWLARGRDRQHQKNLINNELNKDTRRVNDVSSRRSIKAQTHKVSIRERVINAWKDELAFCDATHRFTPKAIEHQSLDWDAVASNG